jgi:hypothetical protein
MVYETGRCRSRPTHPDALVVWLWLGRLLYTLVERSAGKKLLWVIRALVRAVHNAIGHQGWRGLRNA